VTVELKEIELACVIEVSGAVVGSEEVRIVTDRGTLVLYHSQDCCESVDVEDVTGDPADLIGALVIVAEERSGTPPGGEGTWTFYEIRTSRGDLTLRFLGTSNGYYSEAAAMRWEPTPPTF
jgi:hypothetical protein